MRVFISSVVKGMEEFRAAAARAIQSLGYEVVRSEDFGAQPESSQVACLRGVRKSDAVVLLLGSRYGTRQPSDFSATHEEYREARDSRPVLAFVQEGVAREEGESAFIREVENWAAGKATERFSDPESLRNAVTMALHRMELNLAAGGVDCDEMVDRANKKIPDRRGYSEPSLCLVVVGAPRQAILRPAALDDPGFRRDLMKEAQYGDPSILESSSGIDVRIENNALGLVQERRSFALDQEGSMSVILPAKTEDRDGRSYLPVIIEEEIRDRLQSSLLFIGNTLDRIDPSHRLSDVTIAVALLGAGHYGWRTRAEHERSPGQVQIGHGRTDRVIVHLFPPHRKRAALRERADEIAEDLTVLLRREVKP